MEKIASLLPSITRTVCAFFAIANISCSIVANRIANLSLLTDFKNIATYLVVGMVISFVMLTYTQFRMPITQDAAA